jgi:hypothetical protein
MKMRPGRLVSRGFVAGLALALGSYATYAAWAWLRYGRVAGRANADERDVLLDRFIPTYEIVERHHIRVAAPAATTFSAAMEMDLLSSPIVRTLVKGREWAMGAHSQNDAHAGSFLEQMIAIGWGVLAEIPAREIVMGAVTKPWVADVTFRPVPPEDFAAFREPDYVKIVWTLRADPAGSRESVFRTETRAVATDPAARARFRRYWALASPGIILIRWAALRPVKKAAERRARLGRQPDA